MVDKPSSAYLEGIGIDSYERAIVFSWVMLRANYLEGSEASLRDIFQLGFNLALNRGELNQQLTLRFALYYDQLQALTTGFNILDNIIPKVASTLIPNFPIAPPSIVKIAPMDNEGDSIPTLEQYLLYACQRVLSVNVQDRFRQIEILPVVRGVGEGRLDGLVRLDFDYQYYLNNNDLIGSIGSQLESPVTSELQFNNGSQLNNELQLNNGV